MIYTFDNTVGTTNGRLFNLGGDTFRLMNIDLNGLDNLNVFVSKLRIGTFINIDNKRHQRQLFL